MYLSKISYNTNYYNIVLDNGLLKRTYIYIYIYYKRLWWKYYTRNDDVWMTKRWRCAAAGAIISIGKVCTNGGLARGSWWRAVLRNDGNRELRFSSPRRWNRVRGRRCRWPPWWNHRLPGDCTNLWRFRVRRWTRDGSWCRGCAGRWRRTRSDTVWVRGRSGRRRGVRNCCARRSLAGRLVPVARRGRRTRSTAMFSKGFWIWDRTRFVLG